MTKPVLVDTDVLVDFLRGRPEAVSFVKRNAEGIVLSAIVVAELYSGVKTEEELKILDEFIALFKVLPVSAEVARAGGLYRREYHKSYGLGLADAIIAATAQSGNTELKTLNVKHYPMIKGLRPAYSKKP